MRPATDRLMGMHLLVSNENVLVAACDDRCLIHAAGAASRRLETWIEAMRYPAGDHHFGLVLCYRSVGVQALDVVSITHRWLAQLGVVGLEPRLMAYPPS